MRSNRSVLQIILPLVLSVFTLIAIAVGIWLWEDGKQERKADMSYAASVLQRYFELTFYQRELGLVSVGQRMMDVEGPNSNNRRLEIARNSLQYYNEFLAIGLANTNGQLITFTGDTTSGIPDLSASTLTRRSFLQTLTADGLVIGESYYFGSVDDWILPIRVPIRNGAEELVAVNTSAIRYGSLNEDLRSFGFNEDYKLILENETFGTTQLYFPLDQSRYEELIGKPMDLLTETVLSEAESGRIFFTSFLDFEGYNVLGVKVTLTNLNHSLYILVNDNVLVNDFWINFRLVLMTYFILTGLAFWGFNYFGKKESEYLGKIEEERDYSAGIINGTPALIVGIDPYGKCVFINPSAERVTGLREKEVLGKDWWKTIYVDEGHQQVEQLFAKMELGPIRGYQMNHVNKAGQEVVISWNILNLYDEKGNLTELVGIGNDVTELKKAQEALQKHAEILEGLVQERTRQLEETNDMLKSQNSELELKRIELESTLDDLKNTQKQLIQAEKMASLGILSAGIGHEINNPLNYILGGVKGLSNQLEKESNSLLEKTKPFMEVINEGVGRASQIVKSLGHFSHQSSRLDEIVDAHEILENCLVIISNKIKGQIKVEKNYTQSKLPCLGSSGKLHQVFLNILSNAADAIKGEGKITLTTRLNKSTIEFEIEDNGKGIPSENLIKIRDPFFTTKAPGEGTGLGLFITEAIVEEHKGHLDIESKVGEGTRIIITLPNRLES